METLLLRSSRWSASLFKSILLSILLLVLLTCLTACFGSSTPNPVATGPIDGTYIQSAENCAGTPSSGSAGATLVIANLTGTYTLPAKSDGCIVTMANTIAYSGSNGITSTQISKSCTASCSGAECTANTTAQTPVTGTYALSGSTLTLTFTNFICSSGGGGGTQTDINTLTKQ